MRRGSEALAVVAMVMETTKKRGILTILINVIIIILLQSGQATTVEQSTASTALIGSFMRQRSVTKIVVKECWAAKTMKGTDT